jgi:putative heme-binding domain-containing protein
MMNLSVRTFPPPLAMRWKSATPPGPDLAGVTGRFSPLDLFHAIVFPSRDVAAPYRTTVFQTRDGQTYAGLVVFESADGVIVQTGATTTVRLADSDLVSRQPSAQSLMPAGLLAGLDTQALADLYAYLKTRLK